MRNNKTWTTEELADIIDALQIARPDWAEPLTAMRTSIGIVPYYAGGDTGISAASNPDLNQLFNGGQPKRVKKDTP